MVFRVSIGMLLGFSSITHIHSGKDVEFVTSVVT